MWSKRRETKKQTLAFVIQVTPAIPVALVSMSDVSTEALVVEVTVARPDPGQEGEVHQEQDLHH